MATNRIQFQGGRSMAGFLEHYGTWEGCEEAVIASRWRSRSSARYAGPASRSFRREGCLYWQSCVHCCVPLL